MDPDPPGAGGGSALPAEPSQPDRKVEGLEAGIQAERQKRQELERKLAEIEQREAERTRKEAEEKGEHKKLYEEASGKLKTAEERLAEFEKREQKRIESVKAANKDRIAALPEDWRELVPAGLDPEDTSEFLSKLEKRLAAESTPDPVGGVRARPPKRQEEPIPPECAAEAAKHGRDPRWWHEKIWKPREAKKAKR